MLDTLKQVYAWLRGQQTEQIKKNRKKRRMSKVRKIKDGVQQLNTGRE